MMRMDEIMEEFSGSSTDQIVVKRKRTKRPRPSSSASSSGGGYAEFYINSLQVSSPSSTEEDEDMANCLILLARGMSSPPQPEEEIKAVTETENKFSSRKFTEMATSTNGGRVGIYVYECKTCNRTFPSFQALGGHRASHKKPKSATDNDQKKSPPHTAALLVDDQQEEERKLTKINTVISPPPSSQSQNKSCNNDPNKPKIHECSICGAEFASGQALGGHMRRHRPAPKIGASTDSDTTTSHEAGDKKPKNVFSLDLNLPAPQEDEKFSHQQQPHLVFSAAALVA